MKNANRKFKKRAVQDYEPTRKRGRIDVSNVAKSSPEVFITSAGLMVRTGDDVVEPGFDIDLNADIE